MQRIFFALSLASALVAPQLTAAQPTQAQSSSKPQSNSTIQANTNLVLVDVVVADNHRNPVHKLSKADFTVLEDGKPQAIQSFEEHTLSDAPASLPPMPKLPAGIFTNYSEVPATGALNILLLDSLNTPMLDQSRVRQQVLEYLNEARPGTRTAIFGLSSQLVILQGFTSNPAVLRAALSGKKSPMRSSPLMNNGVTGDYPGADDPYMDPLEDVLGNDPSSAEVLANLQQFETDMQSSQLQLRARYTLDAFNQLARYFSTLPGRKNLIWFSGSFPINILPDPDAADPFAGVASSEDEFQETTSLLSSGQVAVYPIDARGLMGLPMINANNSGSRYTRPPTGASRQNNFTSDLNKFSQQTASENGTMQAMAEATGGESFVNTNGLKEAVEKAIEAGSNYYTLSYTPTNQTWNGAFRKIKVQLAQSNATLSYRRGYFASDRNTPHSASHPSPATGGNGAGPAPFSPMLSAMVRGAPEPTQIILEAQVLPSAAGTETVLVTSNKPVGKIAGPYRRYTVEFSVNAGDLGCATTPEGGRHCEIEAEVFVYDTKGVVLNTQSNGLSLNLSAAEAAKIWRSGIRFAQEISVPVKTGSFLRIGVRDGATNRVGAIELPISDVNNLPPAVAATSKQ